MTPPPPDDDAEFWADWETAVFTRPTEISGRPVDELIDLVARRFLDQAGLSPFRLADAKAQFVLERGETRSGTVLLRMTLPLGAGQPQTELDPDPSVVADGLVELVDAAARTIRLEQRLVGPTGWEAEFDD
jgi:hypothetical protein